MKRISNLLVRMKERYGVYIGDQSLDRLATFLSGYECALFDAEGRIPAFNGAFQKYIEERFEQRFCTDHWSVIISRNKTEKQAFEAFFEYFEEFKTALHQGTFVCAGLEIEKTENSSTEHKGTVQ